MTSGPVAFQSPHSSELVIRQSLETQPLCGGFFLNPYRLNKKFVGYNPGISRFGRVILACSPGLEQPQPPTTLTPAEQYSRRGEQQVEVREAPGTRVIFPADTEHLHHSRCASSLQGQSGSGDSVARLPILVLAFV